MKICHFTSVHKWNDIRIFQKQTTSLAEAGFDVHLVAPGEVNGIHNKVEIHSVQLPKNRFNRILSTTRKVYETALAINADIYHFHDPELLPYGVKLAKKGKKVVYDSHEDTPADILDKEWISYMWLRKIVACLFNWYEKRSAKKLSAVISVSDGITNKFKTKKKITLGNLPVLSSFSIDINEEIYIESNDIVYAGGLTRIRNIREMIQSMKYVDENIILNLFGDFGDELYMQECQNLPEWERVKYWGHRDNKEVYNFMKTCALGLIFFKRVPNHEYAVPNKAFEYMAAGIPLLISNIPFWKESFKNNAYFVDPENPQEIGKSINEIMKDPDGRKKLATYNRQVVLNEMNWEAESKKLIALYREL